MLDYLVLALTHGLMAIAIWRLLQRPDLDEDPPRESPGEAPPPDSRGPRGMQPLKPLSRPVTTMNAPKMKLPPRA